MRKNYVLHILSPNYKDVIWLMYKNMLGGAAGALFNNLHKSWIWAADASVELKVNQDIRYQVAELWCTASELSEKDYQIKLSIFKSKHDIIYPVVVRNAEDNDV